MAEEELDEDLEEDEDGEIEGEDGEDSSPAAGGKKRILILIGAAILLVGGGVGAAWYAGALDPLFAMLGAETVEEGTEEIRPAEEAIFIDLPELLVNLNTGGRKPTYLKIRISLELDEEDDQSNIERIMPRIIDNFQVYLRELRVEDLKGSAGMYRLREELLTRVSAAAAPTQVNDVLFKEMLVQ